MNKAMKANHVCQLPTLCLRGLTHFGARNSKRFIELYMNELLTGDSHQYNDIFTAAKKGRDELKKMPFCEQNSLAGSWLRLEDKKEWGGGLLCDVGHTVRMPS